MFLYALRPKEVRTKRSKRHEVSPYGSVWMDMVHEIFVQNRNQYAQNINQHFQNIYFFFACTGCKFAAINYNKLIDCKN
jgi:hypothetical protein